MTLLQDGEERIITLLGEMRAAILRADFPALEHLAAALEAEQAGLTGLSPESLQRIARIAADNAACLEAAAGGLRAARRRIGEIVTAAAGSTYDSQGRKLTLGRTERRVGKVASNTVVFPGADQERINPRRL